MSVQDQAEIIDFRETESAVFADQEGEETVEDTIVEQDEEDEIFTELDLEETIEDSQEKDRTTKTSSKYQKKERELRRC